LASDLHIQTFGLGLGRRAGAFALAGLYLAFFVAPTDHQQGEAYRIIFIHVPAAWMSMILYLAMAFWAGVGWMLNARMASTLARAIAPTGAMFTFIALWTGAFWGKPTWGTWWVWDARLTSELILLFLYLGYIALVTAIDDLVRGDKAGALLALVGAVNVPIIYFSVRWWNSLHQMQSTPETVSSVFHWPLRINAFGVLFLMSGLIALRTRIAAQRLRGELAPPLPGASAAGRVVVGEAGT